MMPRRHPRLSARPFRALAFTAVVPLPLLAAALGCSGQQPEPKTAAQKPAAPQEETAELSEVREFRQSIADRQALLEREDAPSVGQALVTVAERFYRDHQEMLQQAFLESLGELPDGAPPNPTEARLVGSVDAATPEEASERRQLAQFHLAFTPDVRKQASYAFNAAFVPLASAQAEMPVSRAGELYGFFSIAEPYYARCGSTDVCIHYGDSDVFVVNFTALEESLWTPAAVSWWTTVPQTPPAEGIGQGPRRPLLPTLPFVPSPARVASPSSGASSDTAPPGAAPPGNPAPGHPPPGSQSAGTPPPSAAQPPAAQPTAAQPTAAQPPAESVPQPAPGTKPAR